MERKLFLSEAEAFALSLAAEAQQEALPESLQEALGEALGKLAGLSPYGPFRSATEALRGGFQAF